MKQPHHGLLALFLCHKWLVSFMSQSNAPEGAPEKPQPINSVQLYKRLLTYVWPYRWYFILSFIGFFIFSAMEAAVAQLMKYFFDGLESRDVAYLIYVPVAVVVLRVLHGIGAFMGNFFMGRLGVNVVADLRKELFASLVYLPNRYYDQNNSGEMVSLLVYNIQQVTGSVTSALKVLLRDGLTVLALLGLMLYHNWLLTLLYLLITPLLAWLVSIASRYFRRLSRRMQTTMGGITHIANEALQGFRLVRSFVGQKYEIERFNQTTDQNTKFSTKYERVAALQAPVFHIVVAAAMALILFLILYFWNDDTGTALAYLAAAGMITKPLRQLTSINETIQKGLAAAETIFEVIDMPREPDTGTGALVVTNGKIEFKAVNFQYDEDATAIQSLNLEIEPGQTVALVGRSGSGKTTLANLLLRFYEPDAGHIYIDGECIKEVTLSSLRGQVALVNQQTILFNDTVTKNIAYGLADDEIDHTLVRQAAKHANVLEFVEGLPEGFDTLVGEDGARFSGGQRQRIAVARALYKDAPILILDEATSALDNESEKAIQSALDTLQEGRTTIVIAHRLSTIENADKIVAMDAGKIMEIGTHQELMAANGYYASLYNAQFLEGNG